MAAAGSGTAGRRRYLSRAGSGKAGGQGSVFGHAGSGSTAMGQWDQSTKAVSPRHTAVAASLAAEAQLCGQGWRWQVARGRRPSRPIPPGCAARRRWLSERRDGVSASERQVATQAKGGSVTVLSRPKAAASTCWQSQGQQRRAGSSVTVNTAVTDLCCAANPTASTDCWWWTNSASCFEVLCCGRHGRETTQPAAER